ncbi:hypothetical protein AGMMS49944_11120 [Spirochaetia bacterium]|nr:hypothetical protein AGMMS49944_11120 [Spirochaetia bacterium]
MKRVFAVVAGALLLSSVFFGFAKKATEKYPYGAFDIGYAGSTCGSPTSIAKLKGFFRIRGEWHRSEIPARVLKIFEKIGIDYLK